MMGKNEKPVVLFPVDYILPLTDQSQEFFEPKRPFVARGRTYNVKMLSSRFSLFRKNRCCVCCGVKGTVMGLCFGGNAVPHFNLYAEVDGSLRLMTKDHIVPRSRGGSNGQANFQTMCTKCNAAKSDNFFEGDELPNLQQLEIEVAAAKAEIDAMEELKRLRKIITDRQSKIRGIVVEAKRRERLKRPKA